MVVGVSPPWGWGNGVLLSHPSVFEGTLLHPAPELSRVWGVWWARAPQQDPSRVTWVCSPACAFPRPVLRDLGDPTAPSCSSMASDLPLPGPLPAPGCSHVSHLGYNYPDTFLGGHRSFPERRQAVRGDDCMAWRGTPRGNAGHGCTTLGCKAQGSARTRDTVQAQRATREAPLGTGRGVTVQRTAV